MKKHLFILLPIFFASFGCHHQQKEELGPILSSIQLLDRNGITETVSTKERLAKYQRTDFSSPQPYHQVLRIYKNASGRTHSILSNYHQNGYLHQYLEIVEGRANGMYKKWHENGKINIEVHVIEGAPNFSPKDQEGWVFDGTSRSFDEQGNLLCEIPYVKGILNGEAKYYYSSGTIKEVIPFAENLVDGTAQCFYPDGTINIEKSYLAGKRNGITKVYEKEKKLSSWEEYKESRLISGKYYDSNHHLVSSVENGNGKQAVFEKGHVKTLREISSGQIQGLVEEFDGFGNLQHSFHLLDDMKTGEELFFSPETHQQILSIKWKDGMIHGKVRSWYESGSLESQKEFSQNHKQGLSCGWYPNGNLMFHEEYENDTLQKGSYYHMNEETAVSSVIQGNGVATLYDKDGIFLNKVRYKNGQPEQE